MKTNGNPEPFSEEGPQKLEISFTISSVTAEDVANSTVDPSQRLEVMKRMGDEQVLVGQVQVKRGKAVVAKQIESQPHHPNRWKEYAQAVVKQIHKDLGRL